MTTARQRKHQSTRRGPGKNLLVRPARGLRLQPGDLLVLECRARLTKDQALSLRASIQPHIPEGVKVLVLDYQIKLDAVHTKNL